MKIPYKPLGNRLLINPLPDTEDDKKVGQIHLADSAIIFQKGIVMAVGRGEPNMNTGEIIPMETAVGNTVIFRKEAPYLPIRIPGEENEFKLMRENDVDCIVEQG